MPYMNPTIGSDMIMDGFFQESFFAREFLISEEGDLLEKNWVRG